MSTTSRAISPIQFSPSYAVILPVELLQPIFEWALADLEAAARFQGAIAVSGVCKYWRDVSIETPSLWNSLALPRRPEGDELEELQAILIPRVKGLPISLHIREASYPQPYRSLLPQMNHLAKLRLDVDNKDTESLLYSLFDGPRLSLIELEIHRKGGYEAADDLARQFPNLARLVVDSTTEINLLQRNSVNSITYIAVRMVFYLDLHRFTLLPNLRSLVLHKINFRKLRPQDEVHLPHLRRFEIVKTNFFNGTQLVRAVKFPRLAEFHTEYPHNPARVRNFIAKHPTITRLHCVVTNDEIPFIERLLPDVQNLLVEPPCDSLLDGRNKTTKEPYFPNLPVLSLDLDRGFLNIESLERIIVSRCIPPSTGEAVGGAARSLLKELRLWYKEEGLPNTLFAQSRLYREAAKYTETYTEFDRAYCTVLTWPVAGP